MFCLSTQVTRSRFPLEFSQEVVYMLRQFQHNAVIHSFITLVL
jgi:hypothetical protein